MATHTPSSPTAVLGGAINEKSKLEVTAPPLARLLHAQFGLDHYPHYLLRWQEHEIDELEAALETSLQEVRRQRSLVRQRTMEAASFQPALDVSSAALRAALDPRLREALGMNSNKAPAAVDAGKLSVLLREEHEGIFSLQLFSPGFCEALLGEAQRFHVWASDRPCLNVDGRPLDVQVMGLSGLSDFLLTEIMAPLADLLFKNEAMGPLDWRHAFLVGYAVEKGPLITRTSLVSHTDDSECTLNVCLGRSFSGGQLRFGGLRGGVDEDRVVCVYEPRVGSAVLHAGRQLHEVNAVTGGERFALICWARSQQGLRSQVCPCCFMNGRRGPNGVHGQDCICGPSWN